MPVQVLEDGACLPYADTGAGQPVLLVHGWAAHGGFFDALAARLSQTHRVIVPTLRGHPGFAGGTKPLSIETLGEDLTELVEALDLKDLIALGWSMGAMALWAAAPRLGARLNALVVAEMGAKLVNEGEWRFGLGGAYAAADIAATLSEIESDWSAYVARFVPRLYGRAARESKPDLIAWTAEEMQRADPHAMAALWASLTSQDFRRALRSIDAPMLVIRGAESQLHLDGATEFVAGAAPRGSRIVIPGAAHVPHLETPDLFFECVASFARDARRHDSLREGINP